MVRHCIRVAACVLAAVTVVGLAGCASAPKGPPPVPEGLTSLENPEGVQLREIPAGAGEPDLVERVVYYRSMYARSLRALRDYYRNQSNHTKSTWAENELRQVWQIKPYSYIMDVEVPPTGKPAEDSIAEADSLYNEGITLLEQATRKASEYDGDLMKRSLAKFKELLARYPTSDKADKACYYAGMIHDQYFPDDAQIALAWYERAVQLNPKIQMPARFNAARIYDQRLRQRDKALEMYREVLKHEKFHKANYDYARIRLVQLTTRGEDTAAKAVQPAYKQ